MSPAKPGLTADDFAILPGYDFRRKRDSRWRVHPEIARLCALVANEFGIDKSLFQTYQPVGGGGTGSHPIQAVDIIFSGEWFRPVTPEQRELGWRVMKYLERLHDQGKADVYYMVFAERINNLVGGGWEVHDWRRKSHGSNAVARRHLDHGHVSVH